MRIYTYKSPESLEKINIGQLKNQLIKRGVEYDKNYTYTRKELAKKLWKTGNGESVEITFGR